MPVLLLFISGFCVCGIAYIITIVPIIHHQRLNHQIHTKRQQFIRDLPLNHQYHENNNTRVFSAKGMRGGGICDEDNNDNDNSDHSKKKLSFLMTLRFIARALPVLGDVFKRNLHLKL